MSEPAADLGVALAIVSSLRNVPVAPDVAAVGEVGLSGEVRLVPQLQRRIDEAARLGMKTCIFPETGAEGLRAPRWSTSTPVGTLSQALAAVMPAKSRKGGRAASRTSKSASITSQR